MLIKKVGGNAVRGHLFEVSGLIRTVCGRAPSVFTEHKDGFVTRGMHVPGRNVFPAPIVNQALLEVVRKINYERGMHLDDRIVPHWYPLVRYKEPRNADMLRECYVVVEDRPVHVFIEDARC